MPSRRSISARCRPAFTLIEVLVVMGIIVLLIALALPAFNFISGSRSTEAAGNQIAAALGVARTQAIGLQKACGILFFIEPSSDSIQLGLVRETDRPTGADAPAALVDANIDVYLDLVADTEFVKLPVGVSVQTVTNAMLGGTPNRDRYLGFNADGIAGDNTSRTQALVTKVGGLFLFDSNGQLVAKHYAFRTRTTVAGVNSANRMGALLFYNRDASVADENSRLGFPSGGPADYIPSPILTAANPQAPVSQLGYVLFDVGTFTNKGFSLADERLTGNSDAAKETWLDENGMPTMINRYNGTLVRGE